MSREQALLEEVSRITGVRSAILVSATDGLVVVESALDDQPTEAAAAFAARLADRLGTLTGALAAPPMSLLLLQSATGQVFVVTGSDGLLLVAVTTNEVNIGEVRLALLDAAGRLN